MFKFKKWDHIQLSAPKGSEDTAREFYANKLGFNEIEKPKSLQGNGGVWFNINDIDFHIGIEEEFNALKKAHPAINIENLEAFKIYCDEVNIKYQSDDRFPGAKRIFIRDPFNNRLEFIEKI